MFSAIVGKVKLFVRIVRNIGGFFFYDLEIPGTLGERNDYFEPSFLKLEQQVVSRENWEDLVMYAWPVNGLPA